MAFDKMVIAEGGLENGAAWQRAVAYTIERVKRGNQFVAGTLGNNAFNWSF